MLVKNEQQQACLTLHRMRAQLMKVRIMQTNALRGLLYEFGIVLPEGHRALLKLVQDALAKAQEQRLPEVVVVSIQDQLRRIDSLQCDIDQLDKRLASMVKQNQHMLALQSHTGHRSVDGDSLGIYCNRPVQLRVRQAIRRLAGTDAPTDWHRREDPAVGDIQTRRPLM